ncbi:MAG: winged helix-turn-helix transcriptional regulator [Acidobacteria bacterium]|nr:winged helix-turn-helix transcriptional regulator [Acidobacteriota bacterium]
MNLETLLKTLANGRRRQVLRWLKDPKKYFPVQKDGDLVKDGVCGLLIARKLRVSQPTASDHLNLLVRAGLLRPRRIKQWTFYKRHETTIRAAKRAISINL